MKKIVVLGGKGMAGHLLTLWLSRNGCEVIATQRSGAEAAPYTRLDLRDEKRLELMLKEQKPDAVINAAGLLNEEAKLRLREAVEINSLLPHRLADYGDELGFRLFHISTDCVFSGISGPYEESRTADGATAYAKSKSLGEVIRPNHLTIRTSIIGPELKADGIGLMHWFLLENGPVQGYSRVFWNGVTTLELAKFIGWTLRHPIDGLVHLTGNKKLSKHKLLQTMNAVFRRGISITPCSKLHHDKSLLNTRADFAYAAADYPAMLEELAQWMGEHRELYPHYRLPKGKP
ncbi:SDR family oxidoreductase [Paenibacillus sp. 1011MAR3C5]|uniref:dTDP-4-dehydrorhamnose reductase family protein n=1 Tax=Paenibacillus sp. 1011MAR3C5 TaxID=1675787 RepID=UPI000E6C87FD|nr:SDR family oxidoreductase [Paenibacillus sp. 1011MAR3C5]RJE84661.1 SDR family oxidoreductase [Paenibacillus sp. 1011MAR3C5]